MGFPFDFGTGSKSFFPTRVVAPFLTSFLKLYVWLSYLVLNALSVKPMQNATAETKLIVQLRISASPSPLCTRPPSKLQIDLNTSV